MKNFETFKKAVEEKFVEYMGEEYGNYHIVMNVTKKINETLHGFSVLENGSVTSMAPVFYVENMYERYMEIVRIGIPEDVALDKTMFAYASYMKEELERELSFDFMKYMKDQTLFKENLVLQVIGQKLNENLLKDLPHRIVYDDLAVVYRIRVGEKDGDGFSVLVTHCNLKGYGINLSEEELYDIAFKNTKERGELLISSIGETIAKLGYEGAPSCMDDVMYMVSTNPNWYSSALILEPTNFESVAKKLDSDLFIIPSSIMEYLCIPYDEEMIESTLEMIEEVNDGLYPDEILSYGLYKYSRKDSSIQNVATNVVRNC